MAYALRPVVPIELASRLQPGTRREKIRQRLKRLHRLACCGVKLDAIASGQDHRLGNAGQPCGFARQSRQIRLSHSKSLPCLYGCRAMTESKTDDVHWQV